MGFVKKALKKIRGGYLKEMYREIVWLYRYIRKYRLSVLFYMMTGIAGTIMSLGGSVLSKHLIDGVMDRQTEKLLPLAGMMAAFAFGNIAAAAAISRISVKISMNVQNEMRSELYDKILYTKWEQLQAYTTGDLLNRLNSDMNIVSGNVIGWLPNLFTKSIQFFGILAIILYYDPTMAAFALLSAPVTLILSRTLMKKMRGYNTEMKELSSDMMSFQNDSFQNLQTVKAFGLMEVFSKNMRQVQEQYKEKMMDYNKFTIFVSSYLSGAKIMVSYLCFGWSIYRLWGGFISIGTMAMFFQLASGLSASFQGLVSMIPALITVTTSAGRLMAVSEMEKESFQDPEAEALRSYKGKLCVELEDVTVSYENADPIVEHGNFTVRSGEIAAIIGSSGEGKTTMVRLLLGMLSLSAGKAVISTEDGKKCLISPATRHCFSYVPQGNTVFMGTVAENLRLVKPKATEAEMIEALKAGCAWEFVKEYPDRLNHKIGEHGKGLSEGQAQRIAIARAVLRNAPVLLLDEATSALDQDTERRVLENIIKNEETKITIITTHRQSVLKTCDRIYEVERSCLKEIR